MKTFIKEQKHLIIKITTLVVGLLLLMFFVGRRIGEENMKLFVESMGAWGPIVLIAIKAITVIFAPISGTLIYAVGGGLYGFADGLLYIIIGNTIGMSVCFFIARKRGKKAVIGIFGPKDGEKILSIVGQLSSIKNLIIARIVLFPLEDFINYAAGMAPQLRYRPFIIWSVLVTGVWAAIVVRFGSAAI